MIAPPCPYLVCETTAARQSLDLSTDAPVTVTVTWYCRHPFHGIRVELGGELDDAEQRCAVCPLPRTQAEVESG